MGHDAIRTHPQGQFGLFGGQELKEGTRKSVLRCHKRLRLKRWDSLAMGQPVPTLGCGKLWCIPAKGCFLLIAVLWYVEK